MMLEAHQGYRNTRDTTASPRAVERGLLRQIAGELEAAGDDYKALVRAIHRNTELWTALTVDVAGPANGLPEALRAGLISLAAFAARHGANVLSGEADVAALIEINRNVAAGLEQATDVQIADAA